MATARQRVVAALWSLNGIGPKSLERLERACGSLATLLELPVTEWRGAVPFTPRAQEALRRVRRLSDVADALDERLGHLGYRTVFPGEPGWPPRLGAEEAPMLFALGPPTGAPGRPVAVVGTRQPEPGVCERVRRLAAELAGAGLIIVSGAAEGIDQAAHLGALEAGGSTWAFLGCAIEAMGSSQRRLLEPFRERGGTFFSQFPPGARADRSTFRRRNPLISGSSDAVLVARAPVGSGALITADAAVRQGRPLLAIPGDPWNPAACGSNELLRTGRAATCLGAADILRAVGLEGSLSSLGGAAAHASGVEVTQSAAVVLRALEGQAGDVDELCSRCGLDSGEVVTCLVELELAGYVVQRGGGRFERA